jgi:hypothetical protein
LIKNDVVDLTKEPLKPTHGLNILNGASNHYLDLLIEEEIKNEERKKKFEEMTKEQMTGQKKIESLKKLTKVSSSQLAARNHYVLDEDVRYLVFERNAAQEAAQMAVEQRKKAIEDKKAEALQQALRKFNLCPNCLTVPEMKALFTAASKTSDSPVRKKKQELQEQLYREPRYGQGKRISQRLRAYLCNQSSREECGYCGGVDGFGRARPCSSNVVYSLFLFIIIICHLFAKYLYVSFL